MDCMIRADSVNPDVGLISSRESSQGPGRFVVNFVFRLISAIRHRRNAVCLGLDPRWEQLPAVFRGHSPRSFADVARAYQEFSRAVVMRRFQTSCALRMAA